ncbi:MAG: CpaD family pilus assembly lipoprotein [Rhodospirillales bacterium]
MTVWSKLSATGTAPFAATVAWLLAAALASCGPPMKDFVSSAPPEPRVDVVRVQHDVAFAGDELYISAAAARRLDDFLATLGLDRQDHVLVVDRDAASPWSAQRAESVKTHLGQRQVAAIPALAPAASPAKADTVTVVVERYVVAPLDCPDWTQPRGSNPENATNRNFGCFDAYNLGQMVVDKRDLLIGRTLGPADGELAAKMIYQYRRDLPKPLAADEISPIASGGGQQQQQSGGTQ